MIMIYVMMLPVAATADDDNIEDEIPWNKARSMLWLQMMPDNDQD